MTNGRELYVYSFCELKSKKLKTADSKERISKSRIEKEVGREKGRRFQTALFSVAPIPPVPVNI